MASIKISELNETTELNDSDLIPVVDVSADETKKITYDNLLRNNIEVLTGSQALELSLDGQYTQTAFTLNYPEGYNMNNTIVLAFLGGLVTGRVGAYGSPPGDGTSQVLVTGNLPREVTFRDDGMHIYIHSKATSGTPTYTYKIVLMKLS